MAGDWIKMRTNLRRSPKVVRISSALKADRFRVIGGLHAVWCLFDEQSSDGVLDGYTLETLDEEIGWPGFGAAMVAAEWLEDSGDSLSTPRFDEHNGQSAKRRCQESERKRNERKSSASPSAPDADKKRTREEKRREDIKESPIPPAGGEPIPRKKRETTSLADFLVFCKESGERPIPDGDPVFIYAEQAGLSQELLALMWIEFKARYREVGAKKYKDWRSVFRKAVRGNWFKLWYFDGNGACMLTTAGIQARNADKESK